jgi:hypothetical protein
MLVRLRRLYPHLLLTPAVALSTVACAHTPPPPPVTSSSRAPDPPPLAVTYRILRSVDGDGVLLSGRMDIGIHDDGRVEAVASHNASAEQLQLSVRPEDDGTLVARARYEERGQDGLSIKWAPAMRVARGTPARAEVTGSGWARAIELTVQ